MKILVVGVHFHSSFAWSIARALERAGHTVETFEYRRRPRYWPRGTGDFWQTRFMPRNLIRSAERFKPDLLWMAKGESIPGEVVARIRSSTRCRALNWFPDPNLFGHRNVVAQIPCLDLIVGKNHEDVQTLNGSWPGRARVVEHCADRRLHVDFEASPEQRRSCTADVSLVGSCYPHRERILLGLLEFDLKVFGPGWLHSELARLRPGCVMEPARSFEQATVFQASKVNLNTHHPADGANMNQRMFDIAGSGGCQLVDGPRNLRDVFNHPDDLEIFESVGELRDKLHALLADDGRRTSMAAAARVKVGRRHTYDDRVAEILGMLDV